MVLLGKYSFGINAVIILLAGITQGWETALYTIISIYITSLSWIEFIRFIKI